MSEQSIITMSVALAQASSHDMQMPAWLVALLVPVIGAFGGAVVAFINRRPSQHAALLTAMQENRAADSKENARLDAKVDSLDGKLGDERDYSMSWEDWHAAGMPDPPGRPRRSPPPTNRTT